MSDHETDMAADGGEEDLKERVRAARALNLQAGELIEAKRYDDALAICDNALARFGDATDGRLLARVVWALNYKRRALDRGGRPEEAAEVFGYLLERFRNAVEPDVQVATMQARYDRAFWLAEGTGRREDALAVLADLINQFGFRDPPPRGCGVLSSAYLLTAKVARDSGDTRAALLLYDQLLERFRDGTDAEVRENLAKALMNKASTLGLTGELGRAMAVYDEYEERYGEPVDLEERERLAEVLNGRAYWLRGAGRNEDALAIYRAVIERFDEHESAFLAEQVAHARKLLNKLSAADEPT